MTADDAPLQFLRRAYHPDDWVAVFLKSYESGRVAQRVAPVSVVMSSPCQAWLARENEAAVNVYVSVNAIRPRKFSRRRTAIGAIRHVFIDADHSYEAAKADWNEWFPKVKKGGYIALHDSKPAANSPQRLGSMRFYLEDLPHIDGVVECDSVDSLVIVQSR